jgi:hypothetical protein
MAAQLILKVEQFFSKFRKIYLIGLLPLPVLAYLVVLAIGTPHIAIAKEHCARPAGARDSWFLPMVGANRRYYR